MCNSGLEICSKDPKLLRWKIYLLFQKLKCQVKMVEEASEDDAPMLVPEVQKILKDLDNLKIEMNNEEKSILAVSHAVVDMKNGNTTTADAWLTETATELGKAFKQCSADMKFSLESLRAQYYLLYALNAQLSGRSGQLVSDGTYPAFEELFRSMQKLEKMEENLKIDLDSMGPQNIQTPLSIHCADILGEMTQASLLRTTGKGSEAVQQLAKVQEAIESQIGKQKDKSIQEIYITRPIVHMRCIGFEHRILSALVTCDFKQAAKLCLELGAVLREHNLLDANRKASTMFVLGTNEYK